MSSLDKHRKTAQDMAVSSTMWLVNIIAGGITFIATGPLYSKTESFVSDFAEAHYGSENVDLAMLAYGLILTLCIFFFSRATLATLFMMGLLAFIMRFA